MGCRVANPAQQKGQRSLKGQKGFTRNGTKNGHDNMIYGLGSSVQGQGRLVSWVATTGVAVKA